MFYSIVTLLLLVASSAVLGQDCPTDPATCTGCSGNYDQPSFTESSEAIDENFCDVTLSWSYIDEGMTSPRMTFTCSYDDGSLCSGAEVDVCASCGTVTFSNLNTVRRPTIVYADTCGYVDAFYVGQNCSPEPTTTVHPEGCSKAFEYIGGRCVFVDPFLNGTWDEVYFFCKELGAELVSIDNDELFLGIIDYIYDNNLDLENYWIGGTDRLEDGTFTWLHGGEIELGTPYWGVFGIGDDEYIQEPGNTGVLGYDCVQMDGTRAFYFDDDFCDTAKAAICEHF